MDTTLMIKCDIKQAPAILLAASRVIERDKEARLAKLREELKGVAAVCHPQPQAFCPHCNWTGDIADLKIDGLFVVHCPKCNTEIRKNSEGLSVYEFMELPDVAKEGFVVMTEYGHEFDIKVFDRTRHPDMICDMCGRDNTQYQTKLIGTSDSREPKYCFSDYRSINHTSRFVRKGGEQCRS